MASITLAASCNISSATGLKLPNNTPLRRFPLRVAAVCGVKTETTGEKTAEKHDNNSNSPRRNVMFAAAAAAVLSAASIAVAAEGEPKRGSPEAKKLYAPVCVTMPTARICRN